MKTKSFKRKRLCKRLIGDPHRLTNAFNNSLIENRITMMTKTPNKKSNRFNYLFVLPLLAMFCFLVACQKESPVLTEKSATNASTQRSVSEAIYEQVDLMPKFVGGDEALMKFIGSNIKYPKGAREGKLEGKVVIGFVVEKDGSISNVETVKGIGGGCEEEAKRVVQSMPQWVPGKDNATGKAVRVSYKLPLQFRLE